MSTTGQSSLSAGTTPPVQVWIRGAFSPGTGDYARRMVTAVLCEATDAHRITVPPRGVRVRLGAHRDPAVPFPVVAQVTLDFVGCPVRAQARGATAHEAIDLLQTRLRHQLDQHVTQPDDGVPWPRSELYIRQNPRLVFYPRPPRTRQIVRHKPVRLARLGVDEAVREMQRRDYHLYLFTEVGTGQDSVVYRAGPIGYRFAQVWPDPERLAPYTVRLSWYDRPALRLRTAEAAERLGMCEVPFLFFLDADRERGTVLYRRYDGHYGLLRPQGDPVPCGSRPQSGPQDGPDGEAEGGRCDTGEQRGDHVDRGE